MSQIYKGIFTFVKTSEHLFLIIYQSSLHLSINQRIADLIKFLETNQRQFALAVGTSSGRINNIIKGRNAPDSELLEKILEVYRNVSARWLLTGEGDISDNAENRPYHRFVPASAQAGYTVSFADHNPQLLKIQLPGVPSSAITFEVVGDSMIPLLHPGDWVTCLRLDSLSQLKEGDIYVVVMVDGITIKSVHKSATYDLRLESLNPVYKPVILPLSNIKEIWKVVMKTTRNLSLPTTNSDERIDRLEQFLQANFPGFKPA